MKWIVALFSLLALASCGGGGDSGGTSVDVPSEKVPSVQSVELVLTEPVGFGRLTTVNVPGQDFEDGDYEAFVGDKSVTLEAMDGDLLFVPPVTLSEGRYTLRLSAGGIDYYADIELVEPSYSPQEVDDIYSDMTDVVNESRSLMGLEFMASATDADRESILSALSSMEGIIDSKELSMKELAYYSEITRLFREAMLPVDGVSIPVASQVSGLSFSRPVFLECDELSYRQLVYSFTNVAKIGLLARAVAVIAPPAAPIAAAYVLIVAYQEKDAVINSLKRCLEVASQDVTEHSDVSAYAQAAVANADFEGVIPSFFRLNIPRRFQLEVTRTYPDQFDVLIEDLVHYVGRYEAIMPKYDEVMDVLEGTVDARIPADDIEISSVTNDVKLEKEDVSEFLFTLEVVSPERFASEVKFEFIVENEDDDVESRHAATLLGSSSCPMVQNLEYIYVVDPFVCYEVSHQSSDEEGGKRVINGYRTYVDGLVITSHHFDTNGELDEPPSFLRFWSNIWDDFLIGKLSTISYFTTVTYARQSRQMENRKEWYENGRLAIETIAYDAGGLPEYVLKGYFAELGEVLPINRAIAYLADERTVRVEGYQMPVWSGNSWSSLMAYSLLFVDERLFSAATLQEATEFLVDGVPTFFTAYEMEFIEADGCYVYREEDYPFTLLVVEEMVSDCEGTKTHYYPEVYLDGNNFAYAVQAEYLINNDGGEEKVSYFEPVFDEVYGRYRALESEMEYASTLYEGSYKNYRPVFIEGYGYHAFREEYEQISRESGYSVRRGRYHDNLVLNGQPMRVPISGEYSEGPGHLVKFTMTEPKQTGDKLYSFKRKAETMNGSLPVVTSYSDAVSMDGNFTTYPSLVESPWFKLALSYDEDSGTYGGQMQRFDDKNNDCYYLFENNSIDSELSTCTGDKLPYEPHVYLFDPFDLNI
ncbi:hypothetical protein ACNUDM_18635 [Vibrio chaetopteri]|uniref:hypothetical protein n=1 Tax=Vibrio chaetopteri TaxID=3016528 RepID=UPI003AB70379